jgi:molecular chaperone HscA
MNLLQIHEPGQTPLPHAGERGIAVGIDLGTTHSVVAVSEGGNAQVLRNIHGHALTPSVVWMKSGEVHVGFEAKAALDKGNKNAIGSFKRQMHQAATLLEFGTEKRSPVELSAEILKSLKVQAERALGREVTQAVITVPAYFDDAARQATKDAARLAGLTVLRLINEPTAAALAYGLEHASQGVYAIYDLGGGTFDVSLLKLEKGVFQVLATGGDTQLGGDDMDHLIPTKTGIHARTIKEGLSTEDVVEGITRAQYEQLIQPLVDRTIHICRQVLEDAKLTPDKINGVVLVGGATRTPLVRKCVEEFFGKPPLTNVNPDEVVAVGAAIQAEGLTQGSDNLLLDVIPLSLGLETMGGLMEKLIERNTPIPTSVSQEFTTYKDNQTGMIIRVAQGEREMVADNRELAKFELSGIPPLPAGIARIKVTFTVDADGLLTVSATEQTTGNAQHVEVKPAYGLSADVMEKMLRESMENAKADIMKRLLEEAKMEAERACIEVESAMRQSPDALDGNEKVLIEAQIRYVREAIAEEDRERMDMEVTQLGKVAGAFAERRMNAQIALALSGKHISEATS